MPELNQQTVLREITLSKVNTDGSVTSSQEGVTLKNDEDTPGANKVYGTDAAGIKGWKADHSDSPTLTGTPTAPTAAVGTNTTQIATTEFVHTNTMYKVAGAGEVFPNGEDHAFRLEAYLGDVKPKPLEFFNTGVTGFAGDARQQVVTGFGKSNWSVLTTWNMKINDANNAWEYVNADYGTYCIEAGYEGITFHAVKPGQQFSATWHEMLQIRSVGVEGGGAGGPSFNNYIHAKTVLYFRYKSGTYSGDEDPWDGGTSRQNDPYIHLHTIETKGTEGEAIRFEANHTTGTTGLQMHFKKSGGNYFSKAAVAVDTIPGIINFQVHDGSSYQNTARMYSQATALASAGAAPQKIVFQTSATNTAGLTTRMEIMPDGNIKLNTIPTSDPAVAGYIWNDAGTLKISAG